MSFKVIILSRNPNNLMASVSSILKNEPELPPDHIIVVDDGAGEQAKPLFPALTWLDGQAPFIFARNANIGIRQASSDVILMNDDATLETRSGFTDLVKLGGHHGLAAAAVEGAVGNLNQKHKAGLAVRKESKSLCFVCVLIPLATQEKVGLLDERFTAYGWEDNDYSQRVLNAGLDMAVLECCVVRHGVLPSTFRSGKSHRDLTLMGDGGMRIYKQKWGRA